ncbi:MAG: PKD domain-containing protein [Nitrososphaera sp.]
MCTGQQSTRATTTSTYENPGTYTATLTVTDATGQTASGSTQVRIEPTSTAGEPPTTEGETTPPTTIDTSGQ